MPNFKHGGAEGVMVDLANQFSEVNYHIIIVVAKANGMLRNKLKKDITVVDLNLVNNWLALLFLPLAIIKYKPDHVFSTMKECNLITVVSKYLAFSRAKITIREASTLSLQIKSEKKWYQRIKNTIAIKSYSLADNIVVLSNSMKEDLIFNNTKVKNKNIIVIPNAVSVSEIESLSKETISTQELDLIKSRPLLICVGSLQELKNYSFLLTALEKYKSKGNEFTFIALGTGELMNSLELQIEELNLSEYCYFLGYKENPFKYLKLSDVFLLPSLYEGMSNALVQSTFMGIPSLVADSQETSLEWIDKTNSGFSYKSNDIDSFVDKLEKIVKNNDQPFIPVGLSDYHYSSVIDKYKTIFY